MDMKELYLNYGYTPDKEAIDRSLELIASNLENLVSDSVIKECFSLMDLTSLHNADSVDSITKLMEKVNTYRDIYPGYPLPASVCVYPNLAHVVKECRKEEAVHVTAVAGCFPTSQSFIEVKTKECEMAVEAGADEIDIVLALNAFMEGNYEPERFVAEVKGLEHVPEGGIRCEKCFVLRLSETGKLAQAHGFDL